MAKRKMLETQYRASRLCRVLGNPTAYQIVVQLRRSSMTPTQLSKRIGLSLKTISSTLRHMREVNIVRYETKNKNKIYSLKDDSLMHVLNTIEHFVDTMRSKKW
ncbi:MAG: winged helix-turn-helix transcriptional regulator [candidate division WOR-3 bacterium]|nr:MAG: winged helix-turn-helix transcriptional regulator [candidate division WOR-3 bacterium]